MGSIYLFFYSVGLSSRSVFAPECRRLDVCKNWQLWHRCRVQGPSDGVMSHYHSLYVTCTFITLVTDGASQTLPIVTEQCASAHRFGAISTFSLFFPQLWHACTAVMESSRTDHNLNDGLRTKMVALTFNSKRSGLGLDFEDHWLWSWPLPQSFTCN